VYATGMRHRWVILLVLGAGCAQDLPSAVPLGRGPRAEDEQPKTAGRPRRPVGSLTRPRQRSSPRSQEPGPRQELDAGLDARTTDAAAPDAGVRGDAAPDAALVLAGHYEGTDVTVTRIRGIPDVTEKDPSAKTDVEERAKNRIAITLVNSATGAPICTLDADVRGDAATLRPGQPCFGDDDVSTSLASGTAKFADRQLVLDMRLDVGDGDRRGDIEYHFEGTRK
jgi:hypothetical protein